MLSSWAPMARARHVISWMLWAGAVCAGLGACDLNPQPLPPAAGYSTPGPPSEDGGQLAADTGNAGRPGPDGGTPADSGGADGTFGLGDGAPDTGLDASPVPPMDGAPTADSGEDASEAGEEAQADAG